MPYDLQKSFVFIANPGVASLSFKTAILHKVFPTIPGIPKPSEETIVDTPEHYLTNLIDGYLPPGTRYPSFRTMAEVQPALTTVKKIAMVVRDPIERVKGLLLELPGGTHSENVVTGRLFKEFPEETKPQIDLLDGLELAPDADKQVFHFRDKGQALLTWDQVRRFLGIKGGLSFPSATLIPPVKLARVSLNLQARQVVADFYRKDYAQWSQYSPWS